MKNLLLLYFIVLNVFSEGGNNPKKFSVFWNVPTYHCNQYGIHFNLSKYNIIQNTRDKFLGDKVTILYNPGIIPHYTENNTVINGGIPQKGDLNLHVKTFQNQVKSTMPLNFTGVAILDFEFYYPNYNMSPAVYRENSKSWVRELHPSWTPDEVLIEAIKSFNESSRTFFQSLLDIGNALRPGASWGYYHYPYCDNNSPEQADVCKPEMMEQNNNTPWLFNSSTALYPSIYIYKDNGFDPVTRCLNTKGRILEALRIRHRLSLNDVPIYPYFWYRYHDQDEYLTTLDVGTTLGQSKLLGLDGAVIWGSGNDVNSSVKCGKLKTYVTETLGPFVLYLNSSPLYMNQRSLKYPRRNNRQIYRLMKYYYYFKSIYDLL